MDLIFECWELEQIFRWKVATTQLSSDAITQDWQQQALQNSTHAAALNLLLMLLSIHCTGHVD